MADKSKIEWTDATAIVDRGGRRVRVYRRVDASRPGQQLRRLMAARGLKWCRDCRDWKNASDVSKNGLCQVHERAAYRLFYAEHRERVATAKIARKRGIGALPEIAKAYLLEQFDGLCAYCCAPAASWDHVQPVSNGGETSPGNIVPACVRCNSSKKDKDVAEWLASPSRSLHPAFMDVIALQEVMYG